MKIPSPDTIRDYVRQRYGAIAEQSGAADAGGCCGGAPQRDASACCAADESAKAAGQSGCGCGSGDAAAAGGGCCSGAPGASYASQLGYSVDEQAAVPDGADLGLGCGNPLALAGIKSGETVLDLGSGAGFDALLAARALAGTGRVIGVDMTPEMIAKARRNAAKAGAANIEFRLGEIEALPLGDATVDLIISNCVVNLSPDKPRVFAEAFRVLKPGGRLAIADVVATRPLPDALRAKLPLIGACIGGASLVTELRAMLAAAGFSAIEIALKENSRKVIAQWGDDPAIADYLVSATIAARKS
ncbi:MAG: arsenite methyltransferase [Opitutae bacterium]|nr:arsenite methyltransferase [Opitutae bacterium]